MICQVAEHLFYSLLMNADSFSNHCFNFHSTSHKLNIILVVVCMKITSVRTKQPSNIYNDHLLTYPSPCVYFGRTCSNYQGQHRHRSICCTLVKPPYQPCLGRVSGLQIFIQNNILCLYRAFWHLNTSRSYLSCYLGGLEVT